MKLELKKGPLKTAIVSYGLRLSLRGTNVRAVDLTYIRNYFIEVMGRSVCDFVSRKTRFDEDLPYMLDIDNVNLNDYDEVIVYNSVNNIFGGVFKTEAIETFYRLYDYEGPLWYFLCDPNLYPSDISKFIAYKRYGNPCVKTTTGDREVTDEFCEAWSKKVFSRMNILFAGIDYDLFVKRYLEWPQKGKYVDLGIKDIRTDADWAQLPLFEYYALAEDYEAKVKNHPFDNRPYDLVYFGNKRASSRNKVIAELYGNSEKMTSYIVGYDPGFKKANYNWTEYVNHDELFNIIPSSAYATLVIGDDLHNDNIRTPRLFEALNLDVVAFIWHKYDSDKKFISNQELKDFIYVSSREELEEKVAKIKSDETYFRHIVELERAEVTRMYNETIK